MTFSGTHRPQPKREKALRCKKHTRFIHELPCCLTGSFQQVIQHHLLRCPSRSYKAGDQHSVPMNDALHKQLHDKFGDEAAFFASYGITDPVGLAESLWENTGDFEACNRIILEARE